jgi:enoyl-CoA hydratase/carnithine racemase
MSIHSGPHVSIALQPSPARRRDLGATTVVATKHDVQNPERRAREALDQSLGDRVRASATFQEGIAAFRSKRQPRYE